MTDNIIPLPGARDPSDAGQGKGLRQNSAEPPDVAVLMRLDGTEPVLHVDPSFGASPGQGKRAELPEADLYVLVSLKGRYRGEPYPTFGVALPLSTELFRPRDPDRPLTKRVGMPVMLLAKWLLCRYARAWKTEAYACGWGKRYYDEAVGQLRAEMEALQYLGLRYRIEIVDACEARWAGVIEIDDEVLGDLQGEIEAMLASEGSEQ
jgi:hypothetical protein